MNNDFLSQGKEPSFGGFNILNHLDKLTPVEGKPDGEYYCPLCNAKNFKVNPKTGAYRAYGCGCTHDDEGKRQLRDMIAPLEQSSRTGAHRRNSRKSTKQKNADAQLRATAVEVQVDDLLVMVKEKYQTYEESLVELAAWCKEHGHNEFAANQLFKQRAKSIGLNPGKKSVADTLLELAQKDCELFHTPDQETFADITVNGVRQTLSLRRKPFRQWLRRRYYESEKKSVGSCSIQDTIGLLESLAIFDGPERNVHLRIAEYSSKLYLDLGCDDWTVVEISGGDGWQVIPSQECPVRFIRPNTQLALPIPESGGHVSELRTLLNVDEDAWILILTWLLFCFYPKHPHPILILHGEQGSGKSSAAQLLKSLVDPSKSPLTPTIAKLKDQAIHLSNRWVVAYDNLSSISSVQSDAICRTATGGGFATRTLYENDEETVFEFVRPQLLTGIDSLATRGDLLERSILVNLKPIPAENRMGEVELEKQLDATRPRLLGALLTAFSQTLAALPAVKNKRLPRMADFARFAIAAESAMGISNGEFMAAYRRNHEEHHEVALESSPLGTAILRLMESRKTWTGTATELLAELGNLVDEKTLKSRQWPETCQGIGKELPRIAPNLRGMGVNYEAHKGAKGKRSIVLKRMVE